MANQTITISQAEIDQLADAISNTPQPEGVPEEFCKIWPMAKQALVLLGPILQVVPGAGLIAGGLLAVVIAAGDAASKAVCSGK